MRIKDEMKTLKTFSAYLILFICYYKLISYLLITILIVIILITCKVTIEELNKYIIKQPKQ